MTIRVWLPNDLAIPTPLPAEVLIDRYETSGELPSSLEEVEFYVLPYVYGSGPAELMNKMPALKVVQALTAGVNNVAPYVPPGVTLCNARGVHDPSTAELAVALVLSSLRGIPGFVQARDRGAWEPAQRPSLAGKTVLIVGYGSIGKAIAARLRPFDVTIVPVARAARPDEGISGVTQLPTLLPNADVVIMMVPGTTATHKLVNADFLAAMKDQALLVNMARGSVVDTDALVTALHTGRIHAALDVVTPEPLPEGHPLWTAPNLLLTPHIAGDTDQLYPRLGDLVREQLTSYVRGTELANIVAGEY